MKILMYYNNMYNAVYFGLVKHKIRASISSPIKIMVFKMTLFSK